MGQRSSAMKRHEDDHNARNPQGITMGDAKDEALEEAQQKLTKTEKKIDQIQLRYTQEKDQHKEIRLRLENLRTSLLDQLARAESAARYWKQNAESLHHDNSYLRDELARTRQELQASRSFVSTETSDDGKTLQALAIDLNRQIDEFAFLVVNLIPQSLLDQPFQFSQAQRTLAMPLQIFLSHAAEASKCFAEVVQYAVQHETCNFIAHYLLDLFIPGIDPTESHTLHEVYAKIYLKNTQAHSARWRSMAYTSSRPPSEELGLSKFGHALAHHICDILEALSTEGLSNDDDSRQKVFDKGAQLAETAFTLQDKAKSTYLSYDYEPFLTEQGCPFDGSTMRFGGDSRQSEVDRDDVMLVLGFGLQACQSVAGEDGVIRRNVICVLPVSVLTADWT
jgi:hypothetical protein